MMFSASQASFGKGVIPISDKSALYYLTTCGWVILLVLVVVAVLMDIPERTEPTPISNQWTCHEWAMKSPDTQISKLQLHTLCNDIADEGDRLCSTQFNDESATLVIKNLSGYTTVAGDGSGGIAAAPGNKTTCLVNRTGWDCEGSLDEPRVEYRFTDCSEYVRTQRRGEFVSENGAEGDTS